MFNTYLLYKLPIARLAGVKLSHIDSEKAETRVKFKWINQNPFKSMFWAVQGMAAELSTGSLCAEKIKAKEGNISMLVVGMEARFTKKAVGRITFTCDMGAELDEILLKAETTGEGQTLKMKSIGRDEKNDMVSEFLFEWSFKRRSK